MKGIEWGGFGVLREFLLKVDDFGESVWLCDVIGYKWDVFLIVYCIVLVFCWYVFYDFCSFFWFCVLYWWFGGCWIKVDGW